MPDDIAAFLSADVYAVAGASPKEHKYGHKIFRRLIDGGRTAYPLHPAADAVAGHRAYPSIAELPETPGSLSIVTPPEVTRRIVREAIVAGLKHVWMQPGAEDAEASAMARDAGLTVIDDGSCLLVALATR